MSAPRPADARSGVLVPVGYRAGAAAAHIRGDGDVARLDVALLCSERPAAAAGVFTRNRLKGAPVVISQLTLRRRTPVSAIVVNAGNANACTGPQGLADALRMCSSTAEALALEPSEVLVCSTGVIGRQMPMDRVAAGIRRAAALDDASGDGVARAILTTDTRPKQAHAVFSVAGIDYAVGGTAKGAGMLHPDMATLLVFLTSDVPASAPTLEPLLREVTRDTFNCMTVDGDTSPNDAVLLLANGAAGGEPAQPGTPLHDAFALALREVCESLTEQLVADAEGATRCFRVTVRGAAGDDDARRAASTVASSPLVKTAVHGADPNWGRIVAALGRSGCDFMLDRCSVSIGSVCVLERGTPVARDLEQVRVALQAQRCDIDISLGDGAGRGHCWGCDLTPEYVRINADYTT